MSCPTEAPCSLTDVNLEFTTSLYQQLIKNNQDNVFYSPLSISFAFALIHLGSRGNTATQLEDVMHYGKIDNLNEAFHELDDSINGSLQKSALHLANRLFGKQGFQFLQPYIDQSLKYYKAELQSLDFAGDAEGSRKIINDWVESKTANKIKDLIPSGVINSLTALILVNAIYFKGEWAEKFKESATKKADFHLLDGSVASVDMMRKKHEYPLLEDKELDAATIELPYSDDNLSLFVILPNQHDGLAKLESSITASKLKAILEEKRRTVEVMVFMPKFKMEQTIQLHEVLPKMGLTDVFTQNKADLSGVDGGKNGLYVSKAIHKAYVDVNEEGTEAAGATAGIMMMRSMPMRPREFRMDHPFIFAIVEKRTSSVLFLGRVMNPVA